VIVADDANKPGSAMTHEQQQKAWKSIQDELIQNRCWLCQEVFARGKIKKVFMVSHLLKYCEDRLENEKNPSIESLVDTDKDDKDKTIPVTSKRQFNSHIISTNLRLCWAAFKAVNGDKTNIANILMSVDCEVWMSGLICARSKECALEYLTLVPDGKVSSSVVKDKDIDTDENQFDADGYSKTRKGNVFRDKNGNICPPGCDCDNPWQFIQAALMASENLTRDELSTPGQPDEQYANLDRNAAERNDSDNNSNGKDTASSSLSSFKQEDQIFAAAEAEKQAQLKEETLKAIKRRSSIA